MGNLSVKNNHGFTILELITAITVLSIFVMLARPPMLRVLSSMKLQTSIDGIQRQLMVAKSRSLSNTQVNCGVYFDTESVPDKLIIFFDDTRSSSYDSANDQVFTTVDPLQDGITMSINFPNSIIFRGDGTAKTFGTIVLQNKHGKSRSINVISTGRIRVN